MLFASVVGVFGLLLWLFLLLLPIALLIVLQVWLCKKSLKLGLVLPGLSLALSLLLVCSVAAFSRINSLGSGGMTLEQNGQVVEQTITENGVTTVYDGEGNIIDQYEDPNYQPPEPITPAAVGTVVVLFLVSNIPTVVFGGIWLHYKNRRDFQEDLKKMKIEVLG